MKIQTQENHREQVSRAAIISAIVGPLVAPRWIVFPALAAGGALAGVVYFEALAFVIGTVFADYRFLLAMPGLRIAISAAAALTANWGFVFRPREYHALSLR
jgi:hypothetical protein